MHETTETKMTKSISVGKTEISVNKNLLHRMLKEQQHYETQRIVNSTFAEWKKKATPEIRKQVFAYLDKNMEAFVKREAEKLVSKIYITSDY